MLNVDQNFATLSNNRIKPSMFADHFSKKPGSVNYQIYIQINRPPPSGLIEDTAPRVSEYGYGDINLPGEVLF